VSTGAQMREEDKLLGSILEWITHLLRRGERRTGIVLRRTPFLHKVTMFFFFPYLFSQSNSLILILSVRIMRAHC